MSAVPENRNSPPEEFDAYRVWLSIPKSEQPPNHYRLLGISLFEHDPQVIQEGADRQTAHLKTKQTGKHVALSQQLLGQVATASGCLLDSAAKARYDERLRAARPVPPSPTDAPRPMPPSQPPPQPGYHPGQHPGPASHGYQPAPYQQPPQQQPQYHPGPQGGMQAVQALNRPVPVNVPLAAPPVDAHSPLISTGSTSLVGSSTHRSRAKNSGLEVVKIIGGGVLGIVLGIIGFALFGRMDLIYGLVGMSPPQPVAVGPVPHKPDKGAGKSGNPVVGKTNSGSGSGGSKAGGSGSDSDHVAGSSASSAAGSNGSPTRNPLVNPSESNPSVTNPSEATPGGVLPVTTNPPAAASPPRPPIAINHPLAGPPPPQAETAAQQDATAAFREGVNYSANLFGHLQNVLRTPGYRTLAATHHATLRRLQTGNLPGSTIPTEAGQLPQFRRDVFTNHFDAADQASISKGGKQFISGKLLASMIIPQRPHASAPVGRANPSTPDQFADQLSHFILATCALADSRQGETEVYDHLCYLAAACRGLQYSYQRGNAEPFATCQLLDGMSRELRNLVSSNQPQDVSLKQNLRSAQDRLFQSVGLLASDSSSDFGNDPRKIFRANGGSFELQADGTWAENHPTRGTSLFTERRRTPVHIELHPQGLGQSPVELSLSWCAIVNQSPSDPTAKTFQYYEGSWDVPRSPRSLTPKLAVQFPKQPDIVALASAGLPNGMNPPAGLGNPPTSGAPLAGGTPAATPAGGKKLWRYAGGFIELGADGAWKEFSPTGDYFTLQLVSQTGDMLEFRRPVGEFHIRVHDNRMEFSRFAYGQFTEVARGGWIKPIEEVSLDAPQQAGLKRACEQYYDAMARARKGLLDDFEKAMSSNRKRIGKNDERLAYLELLKTEKERFEKEGLVPWSSGMKAATSEYLVAIAKANTTAEGIFNKASDYYANQNQADTSASIKVLKQKVLAPVVIGRFIRRDAARYGYSSSRNMVGAAVEVQEQIMREQMIDTICSGTFRLWSNQCLNDANGESKWLADSGGIWLNLVRSSSTTRERIVLADNGKEFVGQNSYGSEFTGTILDALEASERRPEAVFTPHKAAGADNKPAATKPASPPVKSNTDDDEGELRFPGKKKS